MDEQGMSFWDHLDVLRSVILRMIVVTIVVAVAAFCLKTQLFDIVLAPTRNSFPTYRLVGAPPFTLRLVNIGLTEQFVIHVKTAIVAGVIGASPYILYQLYRFISPALYERERRYATQVVAVGYVMFIVGLVVNYLLIFPLTLRFLSTYSISTAVGNMLTLESYMNTLLSMSLTFGIVFEIPVISWLLALCGLLRSEWMRNYRKHAFVVVLVVAAIITPTGDAFTLAIVSLPIWLLYESSIWIVRQVERGKTRV